MNRFVGRVLIASVMVASLVSAEERNDINRSSNEIKELQVSRKAGHFGARLDLAPLFQGVSIGRRLPTSTGQRANDIALGCNFVFWGLPEEFAIVPTFKYAHIAYKPNSANLNGTKYVGYGLDLFFIPSYTSTSFPIIPNPKISWGKEFDNGQFSEWSVNIVPVVFAAAAFYSAIDYPSGYGNIVGVVSLSAAIEYHYGF